MYQWQYFLFLVFYVEVEMFEGVQLWRRASVLDRYLLLYSMLVHRIYFANLKQIKEVFEFQNMQHINNVKHLNQAPFPVSEVFAGI